jgi:nucleoside-diphosphate-sugar epimerase
VDIRDVRDEHVDGFDAVVHLAALSNDPIGELDEALTYAVNHEATVRLAELARARGVERFVFASSCSMYGASGSGHPVDESAPLAPLTAYAESKVRSERSLAAMAGDDFSPVSLRFATAYGVSPRLRLDIVLNNLVGWALTTGAVRLQSDGTAWRPLIHVEDMAGAIAATLAAPREQIHGEAFNAGASDANYVVRELALMVAEAVGGVEVEFAEGAGADPRSYRVDFSKIADTLAAFRPGWNAERGAHQLVAAYRDASMDEATFGGDRFVRLSRLRTLLEEGRLDGDLRWRAPVAAQA